MGNKKTPPSCQTLTLIKVHQFGAVDVDSPIDPIDAP